MTKYEKIIYMQQCLQIAKEEMDRGLENYKKHHPNDKNVDRCNYCFEKHANQSLINDNLKNVARVAFEASRR